MSVYGSIPLLNMHISYFARHFEEFSIQKIVMATAPNFLVIHYWRIHGPVFILLEYEIKKKLEIGAWNKATFR